MSRSPSFLDLIRYENNKTIVISVRLEPDLIVEIDKLSENRSQFIRDAITFYITFRKFYKEFLSFLEKIEDERLKI